MTENTNKPAVNWDLLTEEYANGASDVEIAKMLGLTIAKFYKLYETNPNFAGFIDSGRTLAQAWWNQQARKGLWAKGFNTPLFAFVMKNRFGWADKVETTDTTGKDDINLDQLKGQVSATMKKLATTNPELFSGVNLHTSATAKGEND